jgi:hypothetical protein
MRQWPKIFGWFLTTVFSKTASYVVAVLNVFKQLRSELKTLQEKRQELMTKKNKV